MKRHLSREDHKNIRSNIEEMGQTVVVIKDATTGLIFLLTIGRTNQNLPELVLPLPSDIDEDGIEIYADFLYSLKEHEVTAGESYPCPEFDEVRLFVADIHKNMEKGLRRDVLCHADGYYKKAVKAYILYPVPISSVAMTVAQRQTSGATVH